MSNREETEYYRNRIKEFSKYNENELTKYYIRSKAGTIVESYPTANENEIYKKLAKELSNNYNGFCSEKEIIDTLSLYGHIYTAKIEPRAKIEQRALYLKNSGDILIYSFLNDLNSDIAHELVHKLGFLKFNEDFYNMPNIYVESGTEIVVNSILDGRICRENVIGNIWCRSVGVQPTYMVESMLVNQLNMVCGDYPLERSILQGKNFIEPELIDLLGEKEYSKLFEQVMDISANEKKYWTTFKCEDERTARDEKNIKNKENMFWNKVKDFQDTLLVLAFNSKYKQIKDVNDAQKFLEDLMNFSDYRMKLEDIDYEDEFFNEYFKDKKKSIEERFNAEIEINNIQLTWCNRYPIIKLSREDIYKFRREKEQIDLLAEEKNPKRKGLFSWLRKSGNAKQISEKNTVYVEENKLERYKFDLNSQVILNDKSKINEIEDSQKNKNIDDNEKA